jgi:hypothetical protein
MAKVLSHTSTNPKLTIGKTPVKGYAAGGEVVDTRPVTQKSRTVYVDEKGRAGPAGTAYAAPVSVQVGRGGKQVVTTPREESWSEYGEGLVYKPYDTSMEAPASAPSVGYGEAPRVSKMADIAKPGDVQYYGESKKAEAAKFNEERYAAYNRRMENEAIRTGNPMPGAAAPKELYSMVPAPTPKSVPLYIPPAREDADVPTTKITTGSLVAAANMLTPKSKVLYSSDAIEYIKKKKKPGEE